MVHLKCDQYGDIEFGFPLPLLFSLSRNTCFQNTNKSDNIWSVEEPISDYSIMTSNLTLIISI